MSELQNAPNFSVIVPIYNVESYLSSALESLISQDLESAEFILVDDGSTDGSNRIILEPDNFYTEGCLDRAARLIASLPENKPDILKGNFTLFYDGDVEEKEYLGRAGSIYICRDILYRYRQDNPGSSINKKLDYRRILNIYRDLLPEIEMNGWNVAKIAEDLYWNYKRIAREHRRIFRKEAADLFAHRNRDLSKIDSRKVQWFMRRI